MYNVTFRKASLLKISNLSLWMCMYLHKLENESDENWKSIKYIDEKLCIKEKVIYSTQTSFQMSKWNLEESMNR